MFTTDTTETMYQVVDLAKDQIIFSCSDKSIAINTHTNFNEKYDRPFGILEVVTTSKYL